MDIIKLPYTSYLEVNVKNLSEFIQNELIEEKFPKDCWIDDIGDNIYYYLNPRYASMSDKDLQKHIDEHISTLVLRYLDRLGVEHGDVEWGDGIDELWEKCNDYLDD